MSREIKFRAWNIPNKQMYYDVQNGVLAKNEKGQFVLGVSIGTLLKDVGSEIMQYTGLKDKNGVEVYEGDIVYIGNNDFGFIQNKKKENVKYEVRVEGCDYILHLIDINLKWGRLSRLEELNWNCKVVGNIYQNLEIDKQIELQAEELKKQETLEEASERILANNIDGLRDALNDDDLFFFYKEVIKLYGQEMARWQAESTYNETEVLKLLQKRDDYLTTPKNQSLKDFLTPKEWLTQFKKK